eukprot:9593547-Alexandrium_andersonii.AAC.1
MQRWEQHRRHGGTGSRHKLTGGNNCRRVCKAPPSISGCKRHASAVTVRCSSDGNLLRSAGG